MRRLFGNILLILGILFVLNPGLPANAAESAPAKTEALSTASFQILNKGIRARRQEAGILLVEGADALQELYAQDLGGAKRLPLVDFDRYVVAAVFAGRKSSGGYSLEILQAQYLPKTLDIRYILHTPPRGAMVSQALTSPYVVLLLEKP